MKTHTYKRKDYTIEQIAYLAGIIDGEGSIYIGNFSCNPRTGAKYFQTNMEVTNSDKSLLDWLLNTFGGRVYKYTEKQTPKCHRKEYYRWIVTGDRLTHLCELLLPYLICKIRQCKIMIEMRKTFNSPENQRSVKGQCGFQVNSKEILDYRQSLMDEIRSLHIRNYSNKN